MVRPGSAKLTGPKGCPDTNAVAATVTGKRISARPADRYREAAGWVQLPRFNNDWEE